MVVGQARIYARYRNGTNSNAMVFYYKNASPSFQYSVTLPVARNYAMGLGNYYTGVFESAEWTGAGDIKLYNLELRNDGSVPPWYIE